MIETNLCSIRHAMVQDLHLILISSICAAASIFVSAILAPTVPAVVAPFVTSLLTIPPFAALTRLAVGWVSDVERSARTWIIQCVRDIPRQIVRCIPLPTGIALLILALSDGSLASQVALGPAIGFTVLSAVFACTDLVLGCLPASIRPGTWAVASRRVPAVLGSLALGIMVTMFSLATFPALMLFATPIVAFVLSFGILKGLPLVLTTDLI